MGNITAYKFLLAVIPILLLGGKAYNSHELSPGHTAVTFDRVGAGRTVQFGVLSGKEVRVDSLGVSVILGSGYAVVREKYRMFNPGSRSIIEAEIPGRGFFRASMLDTVTFGNPYAPVITLNAQRLAAVYDTTKGADSYGHWTFDLPEGYSDLVVHYLVDTHDASLHRRHDVEHSYGFGYQFIQPDTSRIRPNHTGMVVVADQTIHVGELDGFLPLDKWFGKGRVYRYRPQTTAKNVVIRYGKTSIYHKTDGFDMQSVTARSSWLYDRVDTLDVWSANSSGYKKISKHNFTPVPVADYSLYGMVILGILGAGAVLALLGPMIWGAWKRNM